MRASSCCSEGHFGASQLQAAGLRLPDATTPYVEQQGVGIAAVANDASRFWVIGTAAALQSLSADTTARAADADWRLADIRAGLPQVYAATGEAFVAQRSESRFAGWHQFYQRLLHRQEIIARTQHLGRIKRRLFHLGLPAGEWQVGQSLRLSDGRQGKLAECIALDGGVEALAVLSVDSSAHRSIPIRRCCRRCPPPPCRCPTRCPEAGRRRR